MTTPATHAPNNEAWGGNARPFYASPEPAYAYGDEHNLDVQYLDQHWRAWHVSTL